MKEQQIHTGADQVRAMFYGIAVGDALGVPVEFMHRSTLEQEPVYGMLGHGTHDQPSGTFSDDSSLTFCLAEALCNGFDVQAIAQNFVRWYREGFWAAHGEVFDIGQATRYAIQRLEAGIPPLKAGAKDVSSNGNGSLMRIAPLVFMVRNKPWQERFELTRQVSSITHGHVRSVVACFYLVEFTRQILMGLDKHVIYHNLQNTVPDHLVELGVDPGEVTLFDRLLRQDIGALPESAINSSGYVIDTLEASIWCLLTTQGYRDAVLKAVNLGDDTDTTAAVTGGLAGLLYGFDDIPIDWLNNIARVDAIDALAERFAVTGLA